MQNFLEQFQQFSNDDMNRHMVAAQGYDLCVAFGSVLELKALGVVPVFKQDLEASGVYDAALVGTIGGVNKGKSFIGDKIVNALERSDGAARRTLGVSFKAPRGKSKVALCDAQGTNAPVVQNPTVFQTNLQNAECTEQFLADLVVELCDIIVLVVDEYDRHDQRTLSVRILVHLRLSVAGVGESSAETHPTLPSAPLFQDLIARVKRSQKKADKKAHPNAAVKKEIIVVHNMKGVIDVRVMDKLWTERVKEVRTRSAKPTLVSCAPQHESGVLRSCDAAT